jgi:hypothetical protein
VYAAMPFGAVSAQTGTNVAFRLQTGPNLAAMLRQVSFAIRAHGAAT